MSISQINKLFQNKGCNIAVSAVLGIAVISMLGAGMRGCGNDPQQGQRGSETPLVEAGGLQLTASQFDEAVRSQEQQFGGANFPESFTIVQLGGSVLRQQVSDGLALKLARDEGIDVSVEKGRQVILQQALEAQKMQFIGAGELRPDATQQEFEKVFKAKNGVSFVDARKELEKRIDEVAKQPHGDDLIGASVARMLWIEQNKSKYTPTDDKIKEANQTLFLKELNVTPEIAGKAKPDDKAKEIRAEIKGGMSFEAAMDKYMPKPTEKGKKASDQTREVLVQNVENDPSLKALLKLKPGEVSDVLSNFGTPAIYKLVRKGLPADFDTRKPAIKDQMAKSEAQKALEEKVKALDTPQNVKWHDEAYHVLYDYVPLANGGTAAAGDRQKKLQEIIDRALEARTKGTPKIALVVAKSAMDAAVIGMAPAQADELKIKVLPAYLDTSPEISAKIDLAGAYISSGKADEAQAALFDAADSNSVHQDEEGKGNWTRINAAIAEAEKKKLIGSEQVAKLKQTYADWQTSYAEAQAEQKRIAEDEKKRDEELKKAGQEPVEGGKPDGKTPDGASSGDPKPDDKSGAGKP